jgi:hypothetical protein
MEYVVAAAVLARVAVPTSGSAAAAAPVLDAGVVVCHLLVVFICVVDERIVYILIRAPSINIITIYLYCRLA